MRAALGLLVVVSLVFSARLARACGFWSMTDKERKLDIGYLINSASITKAGKGTRITALYLDIESKQGLRVVANHKVIFDFKGDKLRRYGKAVGAIDASGAVTIGNEIYRIELTDPRTAHDMPTWHLTVQRGTEVILESDNASALCAGLHRNPKLSEAEEEDEVRRRVIYYLAWRELGV